MSTSAVTRMREKALDDLTSEFYRIPVRIVLDVYLSYLDRAPSVPAAANATRARLIDACRVA